MPSQCTCRTEIPDPQCLLVVFALRSAHERSSSRSNPRNLPRVVGTHRRPYDFRAVGTSKRRPESIGIATRRALFALEMGREHDCGPIGLKFLRKDFMEFKFEIPWVQIGNTSKIVTYKKKIFACRHSICHGRFGAVRTQS